MMRKINIHKRILLMFSAAVLFSAVSLGIILLWGILEAQENTHTVGNRFEDSVMTFADNIISYQAQRQIKEVSDERVRQVERELNTIREDTEYFATAMTEIMTHPEHYEPRHLPTPLKQKVNSGESYLLIAKKLQDECNNETVLKSIALASNIKDEQEVLATFYEDYPVALNVGSKYGYFISSENYRTEEKYKEIHSEAYHTSYDPRTRTWYKRAVETGTVGFTDAYPSLSGIPRLNCSAPFYDKDGFAGVVGFGLQLDAFYHLVSERTLGESNINFALNNKGEILFSSEKEGMFAVGDGHRNLKDIPEESVAHYVGRMIKGESGLAVVKIDGEEYFFSYAPLESMGWSFGTLLKRSEALAPAFKAKDALVLNIKKFNTVINSIFVGNILTFTTLFAMLFWLLFWGSKKAAEHFGKPIFALIDGVEEIAKGNLDKKIEIKTGDELEELSDSVNNMTAELKEYTENLVKVTAEKQKVATELEMAQNIQRDMLPHIFPPFPDRNEFDLYASNEPAKEMGGDFYDFYMPNQNRLVVTIADVSGKGIGAALFMVISKAVLKNVMLALKAENLAEGVKIANNQLEQNNDAMMFVTAFVGALDVKTGEFSFVNGGHNPPIIYRASEKKFAYLKLERNSVLGARKDFVFKSEKITILPNDLLFLYTDGVTEAFNEQGEMYGEERLLNTLNKFSGEISSEALINEVKQSLTAYTKGAEQSDDITMLCLNFWG